MEWFQNLKKEQKVKILSQYVHSSWSPIKFLLSYSVPAEVFKLSFQAVTRIVDCKTVYETGFLEHGLLKPVNPLHDWIIKYI